MDVDGATLFLRMTKAYHSIHAAVNGDPKPKPKFHTTILTQTRLYMPTSTHKQSLMQGYTNI